MVKMPEYLKKVLSYFKNNEIPRDILISVGSAVAGAFVFDRILRRDEEEDEDSRIILRSGWMVKRFP